VTHAEHWLRTKLGDLINPEGARERARQAAEAERVRVEARSLFHQLWGTAREGPEYQKGEWSRLEQLLFDLGVDMRS
jgi:hypothetical protein